MKAANALPAELGGKRKEMNASEQVITNTVTDLLKIVTPVICLSLESGSIVALPPDALECGGKRGATPLV
jgi:hypothetical protein